MSNQLEVLSAQKTLLTVGLDAKMTTDFPNAHKLKLEVIASQKCGSALK